MSEPLILSGKDVSQSVYTSLLNRISNIEDQSITPGLAVVLVGEDPASQVYVRSKTKKFKKTKIHSVISPSLCQLLVMRSGGGRVLVLHQCGQYDFGAADTACGAPPIEWAV